MDERRRRGHGRQRAVPEPECGGLLSADPGGRSPPRRADRAGGSERRGRRHLGPHRRDARGVEGTGRVGGNSRRCRLAVRAADRPRDRGAEPARRELLPQLAGRRHHRLGRAHAQRRRPARGSVEVPPRAPHGALPRGVALPRHAVGRVRAERRSALGADPAQHHLVHVDALPARRRRTT
jgi:hypothetical protein